MTYPINKFIETDLRMSVYAFSKESSISQQTISTWKQRDRAVASLPIQLLDELALFSELSISDIRFKLMQYELEHINEEHENVKQTSDTVDKKKASRINLFFDEGFKFGKVLKSKDKRAKYHLQKLLKGKPQNSDETLTKFLESYLHLCITLNIGAFSEMTTLSTEDEVSLINVFMMGANNGVFIEEN